MFRKVVIVFILKTKIKGIERLHQWICRILSDQSLWSLYDGSTRWENREGENPEGPGRVKEKKHWKRNAYYERLHCRNKLLTCKKFYGKNCEHFGKKYVGVLTNQKGTHSSSHGRECTFVCIVLYVKSAFLSFPHFTSIFDEYFVLTAIPRQISSGKSGCLKLSSLNFFRSWNLRNVLPPNFPSIALFLLSTVT